MFIELLDRHFIPLFLIIGFSLKLWSRRSSTDKSLHYYWLTAISTLVLIISESLEIWAQGDPQRIFWRTLFSVIGYTMRPTAALSIALIIYPGHSRPRWLWIPNTINMLIYCTAFFSPIAFSFGEAYNFQRGPLNYSAFVVSFFYIAYCVWMTWRRFRDKDHAKERYVLYLCAASCVIAALIDVDTEGSHLNSAIMVSSVFLYMFLRSIDLNRDSLTQLLNRLCFFEDCGRFGANVSAVGSADMNGLKRLNDVVGHEAGDVALKEIGRIMDELSGKNIMAYRIGGDEFAMLFLRQDEETVRRVMETLKEQVNEKGYSVSIGYAMRGGKYASVQDLIRWADENMYANKAAYYRENGHDRRARREPEQAQ